MYLMLKANILEYDKTILKLTFGRVRFHGNGGIVVFLIKNEKGHFR